MTDISPWIQTFVQLGSFGLVCFITYMIFSRHLPEKDKAFVTTLASFDAGAKEAVKNFLDTLQREAAAFRESLKEERDENRSNIDKLLEAIERQNRLLVYLAGILQGRPLTDAEKKLLGAP